jgi:queuine/archaeosine tRNA-ribosyltransferase
MSGEILAAGALTEHNLCSHARLMHQAQAAIASRTYDAFAKAFAAGILETSDRMEDDVV